MQFSPYLLFNGDCAESMKFYEHTLGGKIDAPKAEPFRCRFKNFLGVGIWYVCR